MLLYATLRYATLRYAMLRYATYATLRYSTLLYATQRNATLIYPILSLINEMHDGLKVSPKNKGLKADLKPKMYIFGHF
jgi:hypothetical protein